MIKYIYWWVSIKYIQFEEVIMMAVQYETKATNVGGRKGHVHTDDNAINVDVLPPHNKLTVKRLIQNNYLLQVTLHALMVHLI